MKRFKAIVYRLGYPLAKAYWFVRRPVTEGVRCIVLYEDKILLIKHSYGSSLRTTVGGGIKKGESLKEAVRREVWEEVGINVKQVTEIGSILYQEEYKKDTVHIFIARSETNVLNCNDGEIAEAEWYQRDNLPEDVSPLFKKFLLMANLYVSKPS